MKMLNIENGVYLMDDGQDVRLEINGHSRILEELNEMNISNCKFGFPTQIDGKTFGVVVECKNMSSPTQIECIRIYLHNYTDVEKYPTDYICSREDTAEIFRRNFPDSEVMFQSCYGLGDTMVLLAH